MSTSVGRDRFRDESRAGYGFGVEIDRVTVLRVTVTGDPTRRYELDGDITVRRNAAGKPALTPSKAAERWTSRRGGPA